MKYLIGVFFILSCWLHVTAQRNFQSPLNIGDSFPYSIVHSLLQNDSTITQPLHLKNKVLILDFWNIWCAACIQAFPKMDSLQNTFSKDLQVVLVTKNNADEVNRLFKRIKIPRPDIPSITSDSILNQWFPHEGDPLHVWINKKGKVEFITYGYNATESHISKMLDGDELNLSRRDNNSIDFKQPIISEANSFLLKNVESYSTISRLYSLTSNAQLVIKKDTVTNNPTYLRITNATIPALFQLAFAKDLFGTEINMKQLVKNNRLLIETQNVQSLFYPRDPGELDKWNTENLYSYEINIPGGSNLDIYKLMQQDLNRYFRFKGILEKRWKNCLVLVRKNNSDKMKTKDKSVYPFFKYSKDSSIIKNSPLQSTLVKQLIYLNANKSYPIIDETKYTNPVDITLLSPLHDLTLLKRALDAYGLDIKMKKRKIDLLIIKDR